MKPAAQLRARPLLAVILSALLLSTSAMLGAFGSALGIVALALVAVRLARANANREEFDWPAFDDLVEEAGVPLGAAAISGLPLLVLAYLLVYLPVVGPWEVAVPDARAHGLPVTLLLAPGFWLAALVGVAWAPVALISAAIAQSPGSAANPLPVVKVLARHPRAFGVLAAFASAGLVATFAVRSLLSSGFLAAFASGLAAAWATGALAQLAGSLVWLHADAFGWGRADEALVDLGDPSEPAEEDPEPVAVPPPAPRRAHDFEAQVVSALEAKDVDVVVRLYESNPKAADELSSATLVRVGQDAASAMRHHLALAALNAAARATTPDGAKALVIAARIHDERLRDHASAKKLYEQVLQRFPDSKAAEYARKQLADPRFVLGR